MFLLSHESHCVLKTLTGSIPLKTKKDVDFLTEHSFQRQMAEFLNVQTIIKEFIFDKDTLQLASFTNLAYILW